MWVSLNAEARRGGGNAENNLIADLGSGFWILLVRYFLPSRRRRTLKARAWPWP